MHILVHRTHGMIRISLRRESHILPIAFTYIIILALQDPLETSRTSDFHCCCCCCLLCNISFSSTYTWPSQMSVFIKHRQQNIISYSEAMHSWTVCDHVTGQEQLLLNSLFVRYSDNIPSPCRYRLNTEQAAAGESLITSDSTLRANTDNH
jgi:hypothetical protein